MRTILADTARLAAEALVAEAARLRAEGWRFITASCVRRPDGALTVLYHFERDERLRHLRVELAAGERVPSIGDVYAGAFLVENEMIELQGLAVSGLTIDYGGRLYRDFDGPEGFVIEDSDDRVADEGALAASAPGRTDPLATAASLGLDACVPVGPDGRELRAPGSKVPIGRGG